LAALAADTATIEVVAHHSGWLIGQPGASARPVSDWSAFAPPGLEVAIVVAHGMSEGQSMAGVDLPDGCWTQPGPSEVLGVCMSQD
jgi:hypothetical protein